jgi:hypothetical protein
MFLSLRSWKPALILFEMLEAMFWFIAIVWHFVDDIAPKALAVDIHRIAGRNMQQYL